jgi:hypothetical protein
MSLRQGYGPRFNNAEAPGKRGFTPRGIDLDRRGVVWTALAGSGHLASFERTKCRVISICGPIPWHDEPP